VEDNYFFPAFIVCTVFLNSAFLAFNHVLKVVCFSQICIFMFVLVCLMETLLIIEFIFHCIKESNIADFSEATYGSNASLNVVIIEVA